MNKLRGLNIKQQVLKRIFDLFFSFFGLLIFFIPVLILISLATISTKKFGLYTQQRVGKHAILFTMFKIRTMEGEEGDNFMTLQSDNRITPFGKFLRKFKLDELPQLFNVLMGSMSLVGPRPDVVGYADELVGSDRIILTIKPGITGPATIKFKKEEAILESQKKPLKYNDEVIWKEKTRINKKYIEDWTLIGDLKFILKTIFG